MSRYGNYNDYLDYRKRVGAKSELFPLPPRTPQFPPNTKYPSRNTIYPDMAERKFRQPTPQMTGLRTTFVVLMLIAAFLILILA